MRPSHPLRTAAGIVFAAFVLGLIVHDRVLVRFPNSADEYAYLWQATVLAEGHLTARTPAPRDAFAFMHMVDREGARFSRFPPGFPLLLVPGVWIGFPGVINPLLAALALGGTFWLGVRWVGRRAALAGVLLTLFSPFYLLNAGSYFSHASAMFSVVTAVAAADRAKADPRRSIWLLACGSSLGLAFLIRPYTAALIGVPLGAWALVPDREGLDALRGGRWFRRAAWLALGAAPFILVYLAFNKAYTGSFWLPATRLLDPTEGVGFGIHGHTLIKGLQHTFFRILEGIGTTFFMTPVLLILAKGKAGRHERVLWAWMAVLVVGYVFYWNPGGNRYGPRFYFEALPAFALLIGAGFVEAWSRRRLRPIMLAIALIGTGATVRLLATQHATVEARREVFRLAEARGLNHAVVILLSGSGDMPVYDLTRNPPDVAPAPVLYARGLGEDDRRLLDVFPNRTFFYYRWENGRGRLFPADLDHPETPDPLPDPPPDPPAPGAGRTSGTTRDPGASTRPGR